MYRLKKRYFSTILIDLADQFQLEVRVLFRQMSTRE